MLLAREMAQSMRVKPDPATVICEPPFSTTQACEWLEADPRVTPKGTKKRIICSVGRIITTRVNVLMVLASRTVVFEIDTLCRQPRSAASRQKMCSLVTGCQMTVVEMATVPSAIVGEQQF